MASQTSGLTASFLTHVATLAVVLKGEQTCLGGADLLLLLCHVRSLFYEYAAKMGKCMKEKKVSGGRVVLQTHTNEARGLPYTCGGLCVRGCVVTGRRVSTRAWPAVRWRARCAGPEHDSSHRGVCGCRTCCFAGTRQAPAVKKKRERELYRGKECWRVGQQLLLHGCAVVAWFVEPNFARDAVGSLERTRRVVP